MNTLLKATIAWRIAVDEQLVVLNAMWGDCDHDEYRRLKAEHDQIITELVRPAERNLRLAIEQAEGEAEREE